MTRSALAVAAVLSVACSDLGTDPGSDAAESGMFGATLLDVVPARTVVGDEVELHGTGFGEVPGSLEVVFEFAGNPIPAPVRSWTDDAIVVEVPAGAVSGGIVVREGSVVSNTIPFSVAPAIISYVGGVAPLFVSHGCTGCHTGGGQAGFVLGSRDELLAGDSDHGPVVTPRHGPESVIILKLRGTAGFGAQMPFGGNPLPDEDILVIQDWIDQGVRDN